MTASKKIKTAPVKITAPKISTAWNKVCSTSGKAENDIITAIENLSAVLVLESGLSVADMKSVIKATGKESSFIKVSHIPALPTWSKLRALHEDFKALSIAKQLSTAMASYDLLGAGVGEKIKAGVDEYTGEPISATENLQREISRVRKAKQSQTPKPETPAKSAKVSKNPLVEILAYFTALDVSALSEQDKGALAEIQFIIEDKMANA
jgi:hypothetical protein